MICPNCTAKMVKDRAMIAETNSDSVCSDIRNCNYGHLAVDCPCKLHKR